MDKYTYTKYNNYNINEDYLFPPFGYISKFDENEPFKRELFIGVKLFHGISICDIEYPDDIPLNEEYYERSMKKCNCLIRNVAAIPYTMNIDNWTPSLGNFGCYGITKTNNKIFVMSGLDNKTYDDLYEHLLHFEKENATYKIVFSFLKNYQIIAKENRARLLAIILQCFNAKNIDFGFVKFSVKQNIISHPKSFIDFFKKEINYDDELPVYYRHPKTDCIISMMCQHDDEMERNEYNRIAFVKSEYIQETIYFDIEYIKNKIIYYCGVSNKTLSYVDFKPGYHIILDITKGVIHYSTIENDDVIGLWPIPTKKLISSYPYKAYCEQGSIETNRMARVKYELTNNETKMVCYLFYYNDYDYLLIYIENKTRNDPL